MNYLRFSKVTFLLVILSTFIGCKSKQDQPGAGAGAPQEKVAAPTHLPPQEKPGAPALLPKDKADAEAAAARVLALMESGDFHAIYQGAAAGFKQIGSESQFVAKFQQTRDNVGVLKNPRQISFGTVPGNGYVSVYRLENERFNTDLRLTFVRAQGGKMELAGLNQHDALKK